jgi:hypothetical protein
VQYAKHPEGVLEFQKRQGNMRFERLLFPKEYYALHPTEIAPGTNG